VEWNGSSKGTESPLSGEEVHDWVELSVKKKEKVYEGSREQKARGEARKKKKKQEGMKNKYDGRKLFIQ